MYFFFICAFCLRTRCYCSGRHNDYDEIMYPVTRTPSLRMLHTRRPRKQEFWVRLVSAIRHERRAAMPAARNRLGCAATRDDTRRHSATLMQIHKCDSFPRSVICEFVRCPSWLIYVGRGRSVAHGKEVVEGNARATTPGKKPINRRQYRRYRGRER